jgi:predicted acyltransferase
VLASGGWTLLALALSYWLIDIKKKKIGSLFFAVVGMNSLFIYMFCHVGGAHVVEGCIVPFSTALFGWLGEVRADIITSTLVLFGLWYLCYWMYKNRIFIKI